MFLTLAELVELTGYKRARDQAAYVREHYGIHAVVNAAGECVVVRAHLEAASRPAQTTPRHRPVKRVA
jgi:hypothetical protein